jgi:citrate/tricarballylate utilization protein
MRETEAVAEARRAMEICNACRFCEGYCAVFPAMEKLREFNPADLGYLANLCHGCRGCFYACQYAPPHPFGINLPKTFAEVRAESYAAHALPAGMGEVFRHNGTVVALAGAGAIALVLLLASAFINPAALFGVHPGPGAFYAVIPFGVMAWTAGILFIAALVLLAASVGRFWRGIAPAAKAPMAWASALGDAATLRNLGGGGHGCNDIGEGFSQARRHLHHALFYGFMLCFAATVAGTVFDHGFGWIAPYSLLSLPVVLGTFGGIGMVVGSIGLLWLKIIGDSEPVARRLLGADYALLFLLLLVALTGLALLALRATEAMGVALAVHLGCVLGLFLLIPYSRMVHGAYRLAALWRSARER